MSLFPADSCENLLPYDGVLNDYGKVMPAAEADTLFTALYQTLPWQPDMLQVQGRIVQVGRKIVWYGDKAYYYRYSGINRQALPWHPLLLPVRGKLCALIGLAFNTCLCNLYPCGRQGIAWHSDNEPEHGREPIIASLSLGAARRFQVRHQHSGLTRELCLEHGQLIVMRGAMQQHWLHCIPPEKAVYKPRINLTFRIFTPSSLR